MTIAELFVNLGVKGDANAKKALGGVKKEMGNVKSMGIEAKAAILAVVYGLQKMMSTSMQNGAQLVQFNNLTGLSTKKLQEWQFAQKMAGGSADEVTSSVTGMQNAFAQLKMNEGPIKYLGLFGDTLLKLGAEFNPEKMEDAFYTLDKMREFTDKGGTGDIGIDNQILGALGASQGMIAGLRGGAFDPAKLAQAVTYTDAQAKSLSNINGQWVRLGENIQKSLGGLNAKFGGQLIRDISALATQVTGIIKGIVELANTLKVFKLIETSLGGWVVLLKEIKEFIEFMNPENTTKGERKASDDKMKEIYMRAQERNKTGNQIGFFDVLGGMISDKYGYLLGNGGGAGAALAAGGAHSKDIQVNQVLNFNGNGDNAGEVARVQKDGVQSAYRQMQAQGL